MFFHREAITKCCCCFISEGLKSCNKPLYPHVDNQEENLQSDTFPSCFFIQLLLFLQWGSILEVLTPGVLSSCLFRVCRQWLPASVSACLTVCRFWSPVGHFLPGPGFVCVTQRLSASVCGAHRKAWVHEESNGQGLPALHTETDFSFCPCHCRLNLEGHEKTFSCRI